MKQKHRYQGFEEIINNIKKARAKQPLFLQAIRNERRKAAREVLKQLKNDGKISEFIEIQEMTRTSIIEGVTFFLITGDRRVIRLTLVGPKWFQKTDERKKRRFESKNNKIVIIDLGQTESEVIDSIKKQIGLIINNSAKLTE